MRSLEQQQILNHHVVSTSDFHQLANSAPKATRASLFQSLELKKSRGMTLNTVLHINTYSSCALLNVLTEQKHRKLPDEHESPHHSTALPRHQASAVGYQFPRTKDIALWKKNKYQRCIHNNVYVSGQILIIDVQLQ